MKRVFQKFFDAACAVVLLFTPLVVTAAPPGVPRTLDDLYHVICNASNWLFWFVTVIAVAAFLYGALLFFGTGGNEQSVSHARQMLTYAIVGVVVAILARSFIFVIGNFLGANTTGLFGIGC